jgi:hypothetical protein
MSASSIPNLSRNNAGQGGSDNDGFLYLATVFSNYTDHVAVKRRMHANGGALCVVKSTGAVL